MVILNSLFKNTFITHVQHNKNSNAGFCAVHCYLFMRKLLSNSMCSLSIVTHNSILDFLSFYFYYKCPFFCFK